MVVNGQSLSLQVLPEATLVSLLEYFRLSPQRVAVEINGEILPREEFFKRKLQEEDNIEIIHFAGGG
ncbi:MAG: sulfur carrier protein ThiS [Leptospiraceae bacterium]|nr:sulfur carrier protein ThiS [Leptospiraceae bacterium]MDW8305452.1 sulfur carrier protein ThiS [Leptospiraceae bacterium]